MIILGKSDFTLYTQIVGTLGHILWNWLFVSRLGMGIKGTGIATTITNVLIYGANWVVLMRQKDLEEATSVSIRHPEIRRDLKTYLSMGIPAIGMNLLSWSS